MRKREKYADQKTGKIPGLRKHALSVMLAGMLLLGASCGLYGCQGALDDAGQTEMTEKHRK